MSCGVSDPTSCVTDVIDGAAKGVANDVFGSIAQGFGDAATGALSWLWTQLGTATSVNLSSAGVRTDLIATTAIAGIIAVALLMIQVIVSGLRQDFGGIARAVRGIAVAFIGAVAAVSITGLLLSAVDQLSNGIVEYAYGTNTEGLGKKLLSAEALGSLGAVPLFLVSIILLIAVVVVWAALMIRKMLIIVAAVFAPIAFAGATADITKGWVRKWIEFTVALVFSKLILVIMWMVGLSVLDGAGAAAHATNGLTNLAIGTLLLLLGGLAPWLAIRMVHFTGTHFEQIHGQAGAARAGVVAVASAPQKASSLHSRVASMQSTLGKQSHGGRPGGQGNPAGQLNSKTAQATSNASARLAPAGQSGLAAGGPAGAALAGIAITGNAARGAAEATGRAVAQPAWSGGNPTASPPSPPGTAGSDGPKPRNSGTNAARPPTRT